MKTLVIKSNNGNHQGINRTWEVLHICATKKEAFERLIDESKSINDNHLIRNDRAYDPYNKEYICTNGQESFTDALTIYCLLTSEDVYDCFFDGGTYGYINNEIKEVLDIDEQF